MTLLFYVPDQMFEIVDDISYKTSCKTGKTIADCLKSQRLKVWNHSRVMKLQDKFMTPVVATVRQQGAVGFNITHFKDSAHFTSQLLIFCKLVWRLIHA